MRGISTVVDVTVCLLLVSAAVLLLALPVTEPPPDRGADETAAVLTTTTDDLEYRLAADRLDAATDTKIPADAGAPTRTRHGTLAGLAGRAALAKVAIDGEPVAPESAAFREQVVAEMEATIPARTFVRVRWEPYPGAAVSGTVEAGAPPPSGADVQSATRRIPLPDLATEPSQATFEAVARTVATALVTSLVPERAGERPMGDPVVIASVVNRFEVLAGDFDAWGAYHAGEMELLVTEAIDGVAAVLEADLREQYDSPEGATDALTTGFAWLTIERWEP